MDKGVRRLGEENIVRVEAAGVTLEGNLMVPEDALGVVMFAHGSGSSRHSPRNRYVAEQLHQDAIGTLLMDLLTAPEELLRRERQYRGERPPIAVSGKTVMLVDDGLATGSSMRAAAAALRQQGAAKIVVAVPVAARATCDQLRSEGYEVVCASTPEPFFAVGQWYTDFSQTSDEEVRELLERSVVNDS